MSQVVIPALSFAALVAGFCFACAAPKPRSGGTSPGEGDPDLVAILSRIREEERLPALAMALIRSDGIRKVAAAIVEIVPRLEP